MSFLFLFLLMIRRPPRSTRTDTLFPYTPLFRSLVLSCPLRRGWSLFRRRPPYRPRRLVMPPQIFVDGAPYDPRNGDVVLVREGVQRVVVNRKSTRLNSSH